MSASERIMMSRLTATVRKRLDFAKPVPRALIEECLAIASGESGAAWGRWCWRPSRREGAILSATDNRAAAHERDGDHEQVRAGLRLGGSWQHN